MRRFDEAAEKYRSRLDLSSTSDPAIEASLIRAKIGTGDSDPALPEALRDLFMKNKDDYRVVRAYTGFLVNCGDFQSAIAVLSDLTGPLVDIDRCAIEWKAGDVAAAIASANKAYLQDQTNPEILASVGVGHAVEGRFGLAVEAIRKSLAIRPNYRFAQFALAEVYAMAGDAEASVELLLQLKRKRSDFVNRVKTESTFDPIRQSEIFNHFVRSL